MGKPDKQNLSILVVLLAVLGLTVWLGYRMTRPPTTNAVKEATTTAKTSNSPAPSDARILDWTNPEVAEDAGKRNVFQYQQAPLPPPPPPPRGGPSAGINPGGLPSTPVAPPIAPPVTRPQPPPIPLKYQGFAVTTSPTRGMTAFLADDARHYNVTVGEVLMGRFRIVSITDKSVEIEDLENSRRQTLPVQK
jgi:hypothetical protein